MSLFLFCRIKMWYDIVVIYFGRPAQLRRVKIASKSYLLRRLLGSLSFSLSLLNFLHLSIQWPTGLTDQLEETRESRHLKERSPPLNHHWIQTYRAQCAKRPGFPCFTIQLFRSGQHLSFLLCATASGSSCSSWSVDCEVVRRLTSAKASKPPACPTSQIRVAQCLC